MIGFIFRRVILHFILGFFVFAYIRNQWFGKYKKKSSRNRELLLCLFAAFLWTAIVQLWTPNYILGKSGLNIGEAHKDFLGTFKDRVGELWGINLIPFRTIRNYHNYVSGFVAWANLWGNIILFIPYGFGLPLFWRKFRSFKKVLGTLFLSCFVIEFIQFFVGRSVDIDDVLLNMLGGCIGFFLWYYLYRKNPRILKFQR
ncbi:MAG: VanZ family protein [Tissierellia bacterium]|nr:VanZ family protein [Tissierellia bacterium]